MDSKYILQFIKVYKIFKKDLFLFAIKFLFFFFFFEEKENVIYLKCIELCYALQDTHAEEKMKDMCACVCTFR